MNEPLVSIIIPLYNCEKYIEDSILSIFDQIYNNYEIIIINDCSTDKSLDTLLNVLQNLPEWFRKTVLLINNKINGGCFKSRTEAIKASNGKYIAIQDADDISIHNRLKTQVEFMEKHTDIWCVGGFAVKIDDNNKLGDIMDYSPQNNNEIIDMLVKRCMNPILDPSVLFRKKDFEELGGYSLKKDRELVDDMDLWCKSLLVNKKIYNLKEVLVKYRVNDEGNTMKYQKKMIKQHMVVWREFMKGYRNGYKNNQKNVI